MKKRNQPESQEVEWKISWQDEYLKWLCGYANVSGGHLFIGVNDDGYVVGLKDFRKLLEILPNRIRDELGIVASVLYHSAPHRGANIRFGTDGTKKEGNKIPERIKQKAENRYICSEYKPANQKEQKKLEEMENHIPVYVNADGSLDYLEIIVEAYPHTISYNGRVYKRSGSTLQTLNGSELERFVLERRGKSWDELPVPQAKVSDLDKKAIESYREKAVKRGRRTRQQVNKSDKQILEDLKAIDEDGYLSRAAILFFHPDPERFFTGAFIKIGFFGKPGEYGDNKYNDVIYHDDIHGPAILQIDKTVDIIYSKYMKAMIAYEGLQRIETYMWPEDAFREVLLNAICNKDYRSGNPIQIKVYDERISVFNEGYWPVDKLAVEDVYLEHSSYPGNPKLAGLFYEAGEIETWGSGFLKIQEECERANAPLPEIEIGEGSTPKKGVIVRCNAGELYIKLLRGKGKRIKSEHSIDEMDASTSIAEKRELAVERMQSVLSEKLTDREKQVVLPIVEYLLENDSITTKTVVELTGKGLTSAQRYLNRMLDLGVLVKSGQSVNTAYMVADSPVE